MSLQKIYKSEADQQRYGLYLVFMLTYIPGKMMSGIKHVPEQLFFDAGVTLAHMDKMLWDFPEIPDSFKGRAADNIWAMESFPQIRKHMAEVKDEKRRLLVESIIKTFEEEVAPKISTLRKCLIHNDYNDDNILVTQVSSCSRSRGSDTNNLSPAKKTKPHPIYGIVGVIDFTDMAYSCQLFEIANAMAFVMYTNTADPTAATAYLLAGFQSVIPLNAKELDLLYICLVAHLVHELVLSLYNHRLQPDNAHVTVTQRCGWKYVQEMWENAGARERIENLWKDIGDSYRG